MRLTHPPLWQRLTIASLAVLAALLIRLALAPLTGTAGPFLLFFSAVLLSAWVGGNASGMLATALAAPIAALVFLRPSLTLSGGLLGPTILIALFVLDALLISGITGRLQATGARAARQQAELTSLTDGVQDYAIFLLDPTGRVASWNTGAERITGYPAAAAIGQPLAHFYPPEEVAAGLPATALATAATTGRYAGEGWRVRQDGSRFWASVVITPVRNSAGRLTGFAKVTRDVTEPRQQEEALRASEARFAGIVTAALDAIVGIDAAERVVVFNPAAERLFGYPAAQVLGQPLDRFLPATARARHHGQIAAFGASGQTNRAMGKPGPVSGVRADGTLLPLEASIARLTVDGQPFYAAILRDISARLAAEQALRAARDELEARVTERTADLAAANVTLASQAAELRASEARFQAFMDHSPAAAWITDADGALRYASATYHRVFALPTADPIGKTIFELYPEETAQAFLATTQTVAARGEALESIERVRRPDGRAGEFLVYKFPLPTDAQPMIGGVAVEITQLRETETRLRTSLHEKEVLLKEIHHRVKNNLQVVVSLLRLQGRQVREPTAVAALRESRQRVEVMALVHELLYRAGDLASIDAAAYLQQLSTQLLRLYAGAPGQVRLTVEAEPLALSLDQAVPCGLIISELLANSLKYAFPDGQGGTIGIALTAMPANTATLRVWDTGVGLTGSSATTQPTSLGMTLVSDLVRQLHGTLQLDGASGVTTTIIFPMGTPSALLTAADEASL
ncbi:MAG: PAS domain S-box protein [Chloroflexales bacterium]|nr:PAS domain S-box protein [Chloroflexales bacterium]